MATPRRRKVDIELDRLREFFNDDSLKDTFGGDSAFLGMPGEGESGIDVAIRAMRHMSDALENLRQVNASLMQHKEQLVARVDQMQEEADERSRRERFAARAGTTACDPPSAEYEQTIERGSSSWLPWIFVTALLAPLLWIAAAGYAVRHHPELVRPDYNAPSSR